MQTKVYDDWGQLQSEEDKAEWKLKEEAAQASETQFNIKGADLGEYKAVGSRIFTSDATPAMWSSTKHTP
ncbi:hypothetical protein F25303_9477 [Fusarium sp. NRRL 25303]|nr:hypothetical protein F25303_9477 [Fusarium sp. NRRL 25303]